MTGNSRRKPIIEDGQRKGTIASQANHGGGIQASLPDIQTRENMDDLGLTHKQSSTFQQTASIPEDDFENFFEEKKYAADKAVSELTISGTVRLPAKVFLCYWLSGPSAARL